MCLHKGSIQFYKIDGMIEHTIQMLIGLSVIFLAGKKAKSGRKRYFSFEIMCLVFVTLEILADL